MAVVPHSRFANAGRYQPSGGIPSFPHGADEITPSNDDTHEPPISVYVGVAGDVAVVPAASPTGDPVVFKNVPAGSVLPCQVVKVMSTNTTATDLVALY